MEKTYPSDITQEQFNKIAPLLERARKKTRPRTLDLHDVFNGLLYIVNTGCQWRSMPSEYPKWRSVHHYFLVWSEIPRGKTESILSQVLKKISKRRAYEKWQKMLHEYGHC